MKTKIVQVFVPGGILGINVLNKIIRACQSVQTKSFQFGHRQQIIIEVAESDVKKLKYYLTGFDVLEEGETPRYNIITSYLAQNISLTTFWVREGIYLDILDQFSESPKVRVNISDLKQDFVYSFTGDINFVASEETNYWNVYLRRREHGNLRFFPLIIHSDDIQRFVKSYEAKFTHKKFNYKDVIPTLVSEFQDRGIDVQITPRIRVSEFHNYEGLHLHNEKYWIGIYTRTTSFDLSKLEAIQQLAQIQNIGKICITPWKSILIEGILQENLTDWKYLLVKNGINIGHSHAELNWQINDFDKEAQELKAYLRKELALRDLPNFGVIYGINNEPSYSFSHIVIKQKSRAEIARSYEPVSYEVLYRKDFNPTINEFISYKARIPIDNLTNILEEVVELYYKSAFEEFNSFTPRPSAALEEYDDTKSDKGLHQCKHCYTVYDPAYGDESQQIAAGTSFESLPDEYHCPTCENSKESFVKLDVDYAELKI